MKKLFLSTLLLALPLLASAYDCQVDGIYYYLNSKEKTAEVSGGYNKYEGDVVIPKKFTYEGVEYSVTSIGVQAFYCCSHLTSVTIPNSVTSIGERAFVSCSGLTSVKITDLAAWCKIRFDAYANPLSYADHLYLNGEEIKDLVIPNSVTSIGNWAFDGCNGLTSVTIPNSVINIGYEAFSGCNGLTSVTIGNSVTTIGDYAFSGCNGLTSVHITDLAAWCRISFLGYESNPLHYAHHLYLNGEEIKDLVIPNSVTSIGYRAFYGCTDLTSVTIPNSVTSIGEEAFYSCSGLTSVAIGNSVTSIGEEAFENCTGLTSVTIGNSVTSIGEEAFSQCIGLTSVTIPNSVTTIGEGAFWNCSGLTSVTIPNSVTSIGGGAFADCKNIETINSRISKLFEIKENVFASETYINAILKIPVGTAYKYQSTAAWNKFLVIEESDDSGEQGGDAEMVDLCIQDSEKGELTIGLEKGKSHTLTITPENGWKVYMIIFNNKNVTAQLNGNKFIIPALTGKSYLNISYEQTSDVNSAKTIPMLISAHEGKITVNSEAEGQTVNVFTMDGKVLGSGVIRNGKATIQTNQPSGESFIVKAGTRSVKMLMK